LPPQNYSQYWNIEKFKKHKLVYRDTGWASLLPKLRIEENEPEEEGVRKVLTAIKEFDAEETVQKKLQSRITESLFAQQKEMQFITEMQRNYFESLGGNGTNRVVDEIKNFLAGK